MAPAGLIPLAVLQLVLEPPGEGWPTHLAHRGVEIVEDDIGMRCVSRAAARQLFTEEREREALRREKAAEAERASVEQDQRFRAQLYRGQPWWLIPPGVTAGEAWTQADRDSQPKRVTPTQEWLDQLGGGGAVHSTQSTPDVGD